MKRKFQLLFLLLLLILPVTVLAVSYNITYEFRVAVKGPTRSFNGPNIAVELDSTEFCDIYAPASPYFRVSLYRDKWLTDDFIGYAYVPRNGFAIVRWTNVGAGNYYLYLSKADDGCIVSGEGRIYDY